MRGNARPILYTLYYATLQKIAEECGYALAIHGSMLKDFDLIAVPFVQECVCSINMVEEMAKALDGFVDSTIEKRKKPHGRIAYIIHISDQFYIDISVMPTIN